MSTDYAKKVEILSTLWTNYNDNEDFQEFIELNDLGLPLAYCIHNGIIESTPRAKDFINSSFAELLLMFDVEDVGFSSLSDISG